MKAKRVGTVALLLLLMSCGGGGGGSAAPAFGPPAPPPPAAQGTITGAIEVFLPTQENVLETEPNDTQLQAHYLGEMVDGRTVSVLGHVRFGAGNDVLDGFSLLSPERVRIKATLSFDETSGPDFFLGVWDFTVQRYVDGFRGQGSPVAGEFHVKGLFALVVIAVAGEADYEMKLEVTTADDQISEREPNELFHAGQFVGEILVGDRVIVRGEGDAVGDRFDSVMVVCPSAIDLEAIASIPPTGLPEDAEFDVLVYDLTGGEADPPLIGHFIWGATGQELAKGTVDVAAGSLIQIYVFAFTGEARWTLVISGEAASVASLDAAVPEIVARPPPRAQEHDVLPPFGIGPGAFVPGEALVMFGDNELGLGRCRVLGRIPGGACRIGFDVPNGLTAAEQATFTLRTIHCMQRCEGLVRAEPNYLRQALLEPDDTFYNLQWHYKMLNLPQAWDLTTGDANVIVAVLDTGSTFHPDLVSRYVSGYDLISDSVRALDGDGIDADPTDPGDNPFGISSFHGTHVGGTIGAETDNNLGVAGVTWAGGIMHLRVLGHGGGTVFDIANAILYAAGLPNSSGVTPARRADVINMSLGAPGFSQTVANAVAAARLQGVVVFAAAGNDNTTEASYPAGLDGVISVGAIDLSAIRAPYSNYGSALDIVAPGGDMSQDANLDGWPDGVLSTWFYDGDPPAFSTFWFIHGTSMACPHAAGVAALILAANPDLTPDEVEQILKATAGDLGSAGVDDEYGFGLVNAHAAVLAALEAGAPQLPPVLALSTVAVAFERDEDTKRIRISNAGGQELLVGPVTVSISPGPAWLSTTLVPTTDTSADASGIDVIVDRTDLADGVYFGRIEVESNGGTRQIQVLARVQAVPPAPPSVAIIVRAVNVDTGEVAAQTVVNPATALAFRIEDVPPGNYRLEAGTDDDFDGVLCEAGELCGAYPVIDSPAVFPLLEGEERGPFNFVVTPSGIVPTSQGS